MARALWFVAPRRVEVRPVELPPLGEGQLLVRTERSGISGGTELLAYRGRIDPELPLDEALPSLGGTFAFPFRYGYSVVGTVERSAGRIAEGTRVFAFHPHQDRFVVPERDALALGDLDPRTATLLPLVETALQIALDAGPCLGLRVAVLGLGPVGTLSAALIARAGAEVGGFDPRADRREAAAAFGIRTDSPEELLERAGDEGVDLAVEASGNPDALQTCLDVLRYEGTALVCSWYGTTPVPLRLGERFHRRRLTLRSSQVSTIPAALRAAWDLDRRRGRALELLEELPVELLATHEYRFDDAAAAYGALDAGEEGLLHAALAYG